MPIEDIEKGDAEGDKYKKVINKAMMQKATKAEVSAKLREMFPEVKNNSVEVNWSPDGKKVEVYKKDSPLNAKGDKCPESGCVQEKGNGKWGVISGKTGKWWDANYDSRSSAEAGLRAYFANGGN
jgi:hypothetical protein